MSDNNFSPDWVSPPGDTIKDLLRERALSENFLADSMGLSAPGIQKLILGRAPIRARTAKQLAETFGTSVAFWIQRESQYRADLARLQQRFEDDAAEWMAELPLRDMSAFGWIGPSRTTAEKAKECLDFFGVSDVAAWRKVYKNTLAMAAFRTSNSFDSTPAAVATWLRKAELEGQQIPCKPWNVEGFCETLGNVRSLTRNKDPARFLPLLKQACAANGVAVAVVRCPSGCRASGATRFVSEDKALLVLSFRHLSDDHFWFTFFHEAAHLVLHNHASVFLEGTGASSKEETEANEFAAAILIPSEFKASYARLRAQSRDIIRFARHVGISPGLVVGQLQHSGRIGPHQMNSLKRRYAWR